MLHQTTELALTGCNGCFTTNKAVLSYGTASITASAAASAAPAAAAAAGYLFFTTSSVSVLCMVSLT